MTLWKILLFISIGEWNEINFYFSEERNFKPTENGRYDQEDSFRKLSSMAYFFTYHDDGFDIVSGEFDSAL